MISVIMGVYNAEATVKRAITSILQGNYTDVEFIAVDDCSTDGTLSVLEELAREDSRLTILCNAENRGLAHSLNRAIEIAKGEYIARQDADDVSAPDRLELSLAYLEDHPELSFMGTAARLVDLDGRLWGSRFYPEKVDVPVLVKYNPFVHPTMLFRTQVLRAVNGYREGKATLRCEDYDLAFRLYANGFVGGNLPKMLLDYTESTDSAARHSFQTRLNEHRVRLHGSHAVKGGIRGFVWSFKPLALLLLPRNTYNKMHNKLWAK